MQPEPTLLAWGALIILYAVGVSVAIFAIVKAIEAVVDLTEHMRWQAARRRVFCRFLSEWRKVEIKHCEQKEKKDGEGVGAGS